MKSFIDDVLKWLKMLFVRKNVESLIMTVVTTVVVFLLILIWIFRWVGPLPDPRPSAETVQKANAKRAEELKPIAEQGDSAASFKIFQLLASDPKTTVEAWEYLCKAANAGFPEAQIEVAHWHRTKAWYDLEDGQREQLNTANVQPDDQTAYAWYRLAEENNADFAATYRKSIGDHMTPDELAQAEQMVHDWTPGDCPSAEHRLGMPGDR